MKNVFIIILFITFSAFAEEWFDKTITEDKDNFYYVGISAKKKTKKEALEDAYAEALKEAVRHNYGVVHQYIGQYSQSENDLNIRENTLLYRSGVQIIGVLPLEKKIIEEDDYFTAYRLIKYPKAEIKKEKARLEHTKELKYDLKPVKMPKIKKQIKEKVKKIDYDALPNLAFIYNPVFSNEDKTEFISIPVKFEYFVYKYMSISFGVFYDSDEYKEDYDASEDDRSQNYYTSDQKSTLKEETSEFSFALKLYPIRTKWISIGFGGEFLSGNTVLYRGDKKMPENTLRDENYEKIGKAASLRIGLREYIPTQKAGISLYGDWVEFKDETRYTFGLSFEY